MTYGSVCSGIEAATVAWEPLGWRCVFVAEIEPYCCALLKHRYPEVPNLGDMLTADWGAWAGKLNVLVGGTPCQVNPSRTVMRPVNTGTLNPQWQLHSQQFAFTSGHSECLPHSQAAVKTVLFSMLTVSASI